MGLETGDMKVGGHLGGDMQEPTGQSHLPSVGGCVACGQIITQLSQSANASGGVLSVYELPVLEGQEEKEQGQEKEIMEKTSLTLFWLEF